MKLGTRPFRQLDILSASAIFYGKKPMYWRHAPQYNDIQLTDAQHKDLFCDTQHNNLALS
jgi:hypothetical protein